MSISFLHLEKIDLAFFVLGHIFIKGMGEFLVTDLVEPEPEFNSMWSLASKLSELRTCKLRPSI